METLFRLFMYIFPYAISIATYVWMFRKAQRVPHKTFKAVAMVIVLAGFGYTLYHMSSTISKALTNDHFHFTVLIVMVILLFFASIAIAFGEPEK